jgi:hypothetical protein
MTRRRTARVLALLALAAVAGLWAWRLPGRGRLRTENYPLVREGLTRAEVEGLLGGPAGN